ncbi:hypothetical protein AAC387_Pa01g3711 [Persea americana]
MVGFPFSSASCSQDPFICSRATDYGSPDCLGTPRGACGYREFGKTINGGDVGAVCRLYRNGTRCGACYQVRFPNYLAFIILYQSGQRDIVAVDLWQEDCREWRGNASGLWRSLGHARSSERAH